MLQKHLIVKTMGKAKAENILFWKDYRVTVLSPCLFRLEKSEAGVFRDEATQAIWYRDMPMQKFTVKEKGETCMIRTGKCSLILHKDRGQVCVEIKKQLILLDNQGNLLGTYRTLDNCNGNVYFRRWVESDEPYEIQLCKGVCSRTGVAVLDDSASLTLGKDGQVKNVRADGSDEYIFAYGEDYLGAVQALYDLTGRPPIVPRYALGNWWSRYHVYTDKEYLCVLNRFEERDVPLTVATVDMDWHYSEGVDEAFSITEQGKNSKEYVGECAVNFGWTGYTWNPQLFPDYKAFLRTLKEKNVKVTLNLHPSDGVRFWEKAYIKMAKALGVDASLKEQIPFDFSYDKFINAYFSILHRPHEKDGVDFWWIDWQQPNIAWHDTQQTELSEEKYDPLWALNHYHYLDNADNRQTPLILSRYAGVGSHRYPIGFSGDTEITWNTLAYLPYFTATASNIGYTWWSHDIGGHNFGEKSNELYVRHLQYGVFSPINRLHSTCDETMTKEPWFYGNGAGLIAEQFLRLRHRLIPYLYTAAYQTHTFGEPLVQPLYYRWKEESAYNYKAQYLFGSQLMVAPVTGKAENDGYARVRAWLPQGEWTDIFTGDNYTAERSGKEITLLRALDSIPVLIKQGGILPMSADEGNSCKNPEKLDIWAYEGNGEYALYEDGKEVNKAGEFLTNFFSKYVERKGACTQSMYIEGVGNASVIPANRRIMVRFKNIPEAEVRLYVDGKLQKTEELYLDYAAVSFAFKADKKYKIVLRYPFKTQLQKLIKRALRILTEAEWENPLKVEAWQEISKATSLEEYLSAVEKADLSEVIKLRLKEVL